MKLLLIATLPPPITGQSVAVQALYSQLLKDGHEVKVIDLSKNTFRQGVSSLSRVIEVLILIWQTLWSGSDFDSVYLTTAESRAGNLKDLILLAVLGRKRKKVWLHLHGGAGMRQLLSKPTSFTGRLNAYFLKRVAGVVVLGERLVSIFDGYVEEDNIRIVKNFAGNDLFLEQNRIVIKWNNTSTLRVLFLSNLLPGKGYEELVQAIRSLPAELGSRFSFDFAGGFESEVDKDKFLASIHGLSSIKYHGVVHGDVKRELFAQAHVFCLPTYYPYEGQPISILEAYASGCAVLTTDHSGIFDIFTPWRNGLEILPHDYKSIAAALATIATATSEFTLMAKRNHHLAEQQYTQRYHLRSLYAALEWKGKA